MRTLKEVKIGESVKVKALKGVEYGTLFKQKTF